MEGGTAVARGRSKKGVWVLEHTVKRGMGRDKHVLHVCKIFVHGKKGALSSVTTYASKLLVIELKIFIFWTSHYVVLELFPFFFPIFLKII